MCSQETLPHHMRGSASPKGEARRVAPPRPSEATAAEGGLRGGGGWGDVTKPNQLTHPPTTLQPATSRPQSHSLALAPTLTTELSRPSGYGPQHFDCSRIPIHSHDVSIAKGAGGVAYVDDGGDAILTEDDRRVGERTTELGDDR